MDTTTFLENLSMVKSLFDCFYVVNLHNQAQLVCE